MVIHKRMENRRLIDSAMKGGVLQIGKASSIKKEVHL
jgi:hypothetical protein